MNRRDPSGPTRRNATAAGRVDPRAEPDEETPALRVDHVFSPRPPAARPASVPAPAETRRIAAPASTPGGPESLPPVLGAASLPPVLGVAPLPPGKSEPPLGARAIDRLDSLPPVLGGGHGSLPPVLGDDFGGELELPASSARSSARPTPTHASTGSPDASRAPEAPEPASRSARADELAAPPAPRDELGSTPDAGSLETAVDLASSRSGTMPRVAVSPVPSRAPDPYRASAAPDAPPRRGTGRRALNLTLGGCLLVIADLVLRNIGIALPVRPAWVGAGLLVLAVLTLAQRALDPG